MSPFDRGTTTRSRGLEPVPTFLPSSPFQNGTIEFMQEDYAAKYAALADENGMATVTTPGRMVGEELVQQKFRIRAACLHWALNDAVNDCRFGCGKKGA